MFNPEILSDLALKSGWNIAMVFSIEGETVDASGSSDGISNREDRRVLNHLRSQADLIVTTGATAVAEEYRGSKHAPIAVLSAGGSDISRVPALQEQGMHQNYVVGKVAQTTLDALKNLTGEHYLLSNSLTAAFERVESIVSPAKGGQLLFEGGLNSSKALLSFRPETRLITTVSGGSRLSSKELLQVVRGHLSHALAGRSSQILIGAENAYIIWS